MSDIAGIVRDRAAEAASFLKDMIALKSVGGEGEREVQEYIAERFAPFGTVELREIPESLKQDPEYSRGDREFDYRDRKNLVLRLPSSGGGRSMILNSHADTVGVTDWPEAFTPREENGFIHGRGACDAKGQIAAIYLALLALRDLGVRLAGECIVEIVIEEEVGGNGALALIRQGVKADAALILEPTNLLIAPANRGAVWYRLDIEGKSVHMGKIWEGVNAIEKACFVMKKLREYEATLIAASRNYPLFERYRQPVQLNFGTIRGDGWPSMVCGGVSIEGGVGFLPNKDLATVKREIAAAVASCGDEWVAAHHRISFNKLHNDAYAVPKDHPFVAAMEAAAREHGLQPDVAGFIASCDARLFAKVGGMPAVVFGPGGLEDAHSNHERIELAQMETAAGVVARTVIGWCGKDGS